MARGYAQGSIFGAPLDTYVLEQLEVRENLVSKTGAAYKSPEELSYLNGRTAFVKLSSSVNVQGLADVANRNVLFGGTLSNGKQRGGIDRDSLADSQNPNPAYTTYESVGMRPMPGINQVTVKSENTFGTLRSARIEFTAWSLEQLSELEKLYLRPGFSALLEWGNTVYFRSGITDYVSSPDLVSGFISDKTDLTQQSLYKIIEEKKKISKGNYDAMYGIVKNFAWSYRTDGGYDCSCDLVSIGVLTESMKAVLSLGQTGDSIEKTDNEVSEGDGNNKVDPDKNKTAIHRFLKAIIDTNDAPFGPQPQFPGSTSSSDFTQKALGTIAKYVPNLAVQFEKELRRFEGKVKFLSYPLSSNIEAPGGNSLKYIRLRDFLALLNTVMIKTSKGKVTTFNLARSRSSYRTFSQHIGLEPRICVLPKPEPNEEFKFPIATDGPVHYHVGSKAFKLIEGEGLQNSTLDIFVGIDYLIEVLNNAYENSSTEAVASITGVVKTVLGDIQENLGGINSFDLVPDDTVNQFFIIDRELTPNRGNLENSKINLTGLRSLVTNLSLSSKLPPNLSSLIAISAQATNSDLGSEVDNMFKWNLGLEDRILPNKYITDVENVEDRFLKDKLSLLVMTYKFNFLDNYDKETFKSLKAAHKFFTQRVANTRDAGTGAAGIIPFELNLTMDGIGGLKISQAFTVNQGIMPENYDNNTGFIITGLDHTIQNNRWETNVKAQIIII